VIAGLPEGLQGRRPIEQDQGRVLAVVDDWWGGFQGRAGSQQRALLLPRLFFQRLSRSPWNFGVAIR